MPLMLSDDQVAALSREHPELDAIRAAATEPVYLVGGAVRDLLLGRGRSDLDLVVVGDAVALTQALGAEAPSSWTMIEHERFATAKARLDGHLVDIATARIESYPHPGALPEVTPADSIEADLARRDFTVNAMAVPLDGEPRLIDPHGGRDDLESGLLRALHQNSFVDDPTRALRAARYAARFGFELEPETEQLLRATDLDTVSQDRRRTELLRLAGEASAPAGYRLLSEWGLIELREGGPELAKRVGELMQLPLWQLQAERFKAVHAAATGEPGGEVELAMSDPTRPSEAVALATAYGAVELVLARAAGATWLDDYLERWSQVSLEIDGTDLIAAGVTEGPAVGRGLAEAKRRKLDGEIRGRDEELAVALAAAREA